VLELLQQWGADVTVTTESGWLGLHNAVLEYFIRYSPAVSDQLPLAGSTQKRDLAAVQLIADSYVQAVPGVDVERVKCPRKPGKHFTDEMQQFTKQLLQQALSERVSRSSAAAAAAAIATTTATTAATVVVGSSEPIAAYSIVNADVRGAGSTQQLPQAIDTTTNGTGTSDNADAAAAAAAALQAAADDDADIEPLWLEQLNLLHRVAAAHRHSSSLAITAYMHCFQKCSGSIT
jgi:hypothetical protein